MVREFSKFLFILGLGLVWLSVTFSALIDPLIHLVYYRLTPLPQVNALMTREGSVFEYSETMQDSLTPWFNFAVALGVILVCVGLLHNFQDGNEDKTQKKTTTSKFFRRNALGAALGAAAILSIVANLFAGPTLRESLPDPRLLSYLDSQSALPGAKLVSYTHSPRGEYTSEIVHLSAEDRVLARQAGIPGGPQPHSGRWSHRNGASWAADSSLRLVAPDNPGIYAHRVSDQTSSFDSVFCVRPREGESSDIAVLLNTNTWAAYNDWGGASLYGYVNGQNENSLPSAVSFLRPNPRSQPSIRNHLVGGELQFLTWLAKSELEFDCLTDLDLHISPLDSGVKLLVLSTHPEYWSAEMYDHLEEFLNSGGSLLYLAGNGIYWKANLSNEGLMLVNKKGRELWRNLGRPESAVLGVQYTGDDYGTYAPFVVEDASHFLFEGLGLANGDTFGHNSLIGPGASGNETDKSGSNSPGNGAVLARGLNEPEGGHIFSYLHDSGGLVLSFGSITSAAAIPIDYVMQGIFWNYMRAIGLK